MFSNDVVALLSSVVNQGKSSSKDEQGNLKGYNIIILDQGRDHMIDIANKISRIESDCEIQVLGSDDFLEQLNLGLVENLHEWSKVTPFATIKKLTEEQEGIIVRTIQRLDETCSNLKDAAKIIGDTVLESKMEQCSTLIRRDIVFAGSLYTKTEVA
jgi:antiviral helicase SKI2